MAAQSRGTPGASQPSIPVIDDSLLEEAFDSLNFQSDEQNAAAYLVPVIKANATGTKTGSSSLPPIESHQSTPSASTGKITYPSLDALPRNKGQQTTSETDKSKPGVGMGAYPSIRPPSSTGSTQQPGGVSKQVLSSSTVTDPTGTAASNSTAKSSPSRPSSISATDALKPSAQRSAATPTVDMETTRRWKDVLVRAGLSLEYAWKYALRLTEEHYDETNALNLTDDLLHTKVGMSNESHRRSTLATIREIAEELQSIQSAVENDTDLVSEEQVQEQQYQHALGTWRNLFMKAKLGKVWGVTTAIKYARILAKSGWDDWNIEDLTEGDLITAGISNEAHREVILQLVERELAEAEAHPQQAFAKVAITKEEVEQIRTARQEIAAQIEAIDEFQERLSEILRGDTEQQREARARRETERALRKAEREQRKLERMKQRSAPS